MRGRSIFGWLELAVGVLLILLGIFTFARPDSALTGQIVFYGAIAALTGVADLILYVRVERYTGFGPMVSLISGILSVMSGVMLLVYPNAGKWILSLLFPIWFIAHCISRLSHLNTIRVIAGNPFYYCTLVLNGIGLILGVLMIFCPTLSLISVSYIVGFYLILLGVDSVIMACSNLGTKR